LAVDINGAGHAHDAGIGFVLKRKGGYK